VRDARARLADILDAIAAIEEHLRHGGLDDGLVFDAIRMRLMEIGEAVNAIDPAFLASEPGILWRDIAGARNWLAHRYFDTSRAIIEATVRQDLAPLAAAVRRLQEHG
jgi:uncharacterized protein with HEPN domain